MFLFSKFQNACPRDQLGIANSFGSLYCKFPKWLEVISNNINYFLPEYIPSIPSYNLHAAYSSVRAKWKPYLNECNLRWVVC